MFEVAELGLKMPKAEYHDLVPKVREGLLDAQFELTRNPRFRVIILIGGVEGAGKGQLLNRLLDWVDARGVQVHALGEPTWEEEERPRFFRFWRRLPPRGTIGIFLGSWYTTPIVDRAMGRLAHAAFDMEMSRISAFERMLVNEDTLLLKFWLHISKKEQSKRFERLESDPATAWRVTDRDRDFQSRYDDFVGVCSHAIRRTNTGMAPWDIVEATNRRFRDMTVAQRVLSGIQTRLQAPVPDKIPFEPVPPPRPVNILSVLDLQQSLPKHEYRRKVSAYQSRIGQLSRHLGKAERSVVCVFEGSDAAGKGGAIRRVLRRVDARFYRVIPVAAPTDEELMQPYLWRFWRHLPKRGRFVVFDRSWYGRVLVERIEGFASPPDWRRAFVEINAFEEQMVDSGIVLVKFWLQISPEEQLERFESREKTGYKRYKLTDEDWRNRDKAPHYMTAACDMIEKTSTELAPWTLVEANDKQFARVKVLETVCKALEEAVELPADYQPVPAVASPPEASGTPDPEGTG